MNVYRQIVTYYHDSDLKKFQIPKKCVLSYFYSPLHFFYFWNQALMGALEEN